MDLDRDQEVARDNWARVYRTAWAPKRERSDALGVRALSPRCGAAVTPLPETARNADRADEQHDAGVGGVVAKTLREYQHQHRYRITLLWPGV